jgi:hypothetical protein
VIQAGTDHGEHDEDVATEHQRHQKECRPNRIEGRAHGNPITLDER